MVERKKQVRILMREHEPIGNIQRERKIMSTPDKIMLGSAGVALVVGPFNPTAGGVAVAISVSIFFSKAVRAGYRRITGRKE